MTGNRFIRRGTRTDIEPKLGRAFLTSLTLHLLVFLIFSGLIWPNLSGEKRPVYYVDLVNLPVERPQAGRPAAAPVKKEKPKVKTPVVKKSSPKVEKSATVPVTPKEKVPAGPSDSEIAERIAAMQKKKEKRKEIDALKEKLAALTSQETRGEDAVPDAPIGMPEGSGDQAGPSDMAWLQAYLKQQWALSEYQVTRLDLKALVRLQYDKKGRLTDFRFLEKSGDAIFDDSVKSAILKSRQLPLPEPVRFREVDVEFNLKDLLN